MIHICFSYIALTLICVLLILPSNSHAQSSTIDKDTLTIDRLEIVYNRILELSPDMPLTVKLQVINNVADAVRMDHELSADEEKALAEMIARIRKEDKKDLEILDDNDSSKDTPSVKDDSKKMAIEPSP